MTLSGFFLLWFCAFFLLPHIYVLIITSVPKDVAALKGLELNPVYNKDGNVITMCNNYDDFISSVKISDFHQKNNVLIKILKQMCADANLGESYHPEIYTSILKNFYDRFFQIMLLLSFFPVAACIISETVRGGVYSLLLYQLLCCGLVAAVNIFIKYKYSAFLRLFFREWYKIINFDLAAVNEIKSIIQKESFSEKTDSFNHIILNFMKLSTSLNEQVSASTSLISGSIEELKKSREGEKTASGLDIIETIESGIAKTAELNTAYDNIAEKFNMALNSLNEYSAAAKPDINVINKNAQLLREVRDMFSKYRDEAQDEQRKALKKAAEKLDKNVSGAFSSVEAALKQTSEKLKNSYKSFSEVCEQFNKNYSNAIDSKQIADAVTVLLQENKKLAVYFDEKSGNLAEKT